LWWAKQFKNGMAIYRIQSSHFVSIRALEQRPIPPNQREHNWNPGSIRSYYTDSDATIIALGNFRIRPGVTRKVLEMRF